MKARRFFAFVAATAMLFAVGCTPDGGVEANGEKATISVTPTSFALALEGGEQTITVTSNADWTVSCLAASDVTFEPAAGSGDGSVVVTVPASETDRNFVITFSAQKPQIVDGMEFPSNAKAEVAVSQNAGGQDMTNFLYYEKCGTNVEKDEKGYWPYVDKFTGWTPEGDAAANVVYSGKSASVRDSKAPYEPTAEAAGVSGAPYAFLNKVPAEAYFVIENLAVTGGSNYTFTFNVSCQNSYDNANSVPGFATVDNSLVHVEFGYDGDAWAAVDCTFAPNGGNGWYAATAQFKVKADATTLYARFTYEQGGGSTSNTGARLDDFKLVEGGNGDELAPEAPVVAETTIAEITEVGAYKVENAWVVGFTGNGVILTDASGAFINVYIYGNEHKTIGEKMTVDGDVQIRQGGFQFNSPAVTVLDGTATVSYPTPNQYEGAALEALCEKYATANASYLAEYVELKGVVTKSEQGHYGIVFSGVDNSKYEASLSKTPDAALGLDAVIGKSVIMRGFVTDYELPYLGVVAVSIEEDANAVALAASDITNVPVDGVTNATANITVVGIDTVNATFDGTIVTAASVTGNVLTYSVSANETEEAREGWIELSAAGVETVKIAVKQLRKLPEGAGSYNLSINDITAISYAADWTTWSTVAADGSAWSGFAYKQTKCYQLSFSSSSDKDKNLPTSNQNKSNLLSPVIPTGKTITKITITPFVEGSTTTSNGRKFVVLPADFAYTTTVDGNGTEAVNAAYAVSEPTVKNSTTPIVIDLSGVENLPQQVQIRAILGAAYISDVKIDFE
ncbi:MAG: hypothetical protein E7147_05675 [Rikenellaceae bacterium]|nr:hypothetical protein [Rikenellaceae bacterium]